MKKPGVMLLSLWCAVAAFGGASDWTVLDGCTYVSNRYNDGDSFHVRKDGKEYIFRLYFVDTPEEDNAFAQRVNDQAAYFGVDEPHILQIGHDARSFVERELAGGFTVVTRWQGAQGRSKIPRHYAFIRVGDRDLAHALVDRGLARVFGVRASPPEEPDANQVRAALLAVEDEARRHGRGAWEFARQLDYEKARAAAALSELKVISSPRTVTVYSPDTPRQRLGRIARGAAVRIVEEFSDGWVHVLYDEQDETAVDGYCLRWDLSLPDLPSASSAIRAESR